MAGGFVISMTAANKTIHSQVLPVSADLVDTGLQMKKGESLNLLFIDVDLGRSCLFN